MLGTGPKTQLGLLTHSMTGIGAELPAAVVEAIDHGDRLTAAATALGAPEEARYDAIIAAIEKGKDPAADREVQRLTTLATIANEGTVYAVRARVDRDLRATFRDNADEIIATLQTVFDTAAEQLAGAADFLGPIDLTDTAGVISRGGTATDAWAVATRANATISATITAWAALREVTGQGQENNRHRVLRFTEPTLDQWEEHRLEGSTLDPWQAHHLGLKLSLASRDGVAERLAALQRTEADRLQAAEDQFSGRAANRAAVARNTDLARLLP